MEKRTSVFRSSARIVLTALAAVGFLAVCALFFRKLNPFDGHKNQIQRKQTWNLWFKVIAAIIPSGVVGVLFDDWMDEHLHNATVVSIALIVYGVAFILVERRNEGKEPRVSDVHDIGLSTALIIGLSQCLSLIPVPVPPSWGEFWWVSAVGRRRSSASSWPFPPCWEPAPSSC